MVPLGWLLAVTRVRLAVEAGQILLKPMLESLGSVFPALQSEQFEFVTKTLVPSLPPFE